MADFLVYRSAIASCHTGFVDGSLVTNSPILSRLFRVFFLKRLSVRTLLPAGSLPAVLRALALEPFEPFHKASLHNLTINTVLLVAIVSGHRISTFHALSVESGHFCWEPSGVRLVPKPEFIAKNQKSSSPLVENFPTFYLLLLVNRGR